MTKHFMTAEDLDRETIEDILKISKEFEEGKRPDLLKDKVLGLFFAAESTRTTSLLKSGIIRAGGGWLGIENIKGTYLESGEEGLMDTVNSLADASDMIAIRGPYDPEIFRVVKVPVVNAMMGDDHAIAALWLLYSIWKRFGKLEGLKIGAYGMIRYSRPIKSFYRLWSKFGMKFYENSILPEAGSQEEVIKEIEKNGSALEKKPLDEMMKEVDFFIIAEALPQKGADETTVNEFHKQFKTVDEEFMKKLNPNAYWMYVMPRKTMDGRLTTDEKLDLHEKNLSWTFMKESTNCNVGMFYKLLEMSK